MSAWDQRCAQVLPRLAGGEASLGACGSHSPIVGPRRYTEFTAFKHLDATRGIHHRVPFARELVRLWRATVPLFRWADTMYSRPHGEVKGQPRLIATMSRSQNG